jgi:hypothetical protein
VLGINLHSGNPQHFDFFDGNGVQRDVIEVDNAQLKEVNLVFTDIGGDPLAPPGNGGFNPKDGLDKVTNLSWDIYEPTFGDDQTYNGAWVWSDTDDNGRFDPATPFQAALELARELGNARLLSVNGYGHTVLRNPSACAARHEAAYLIEGTLPPEGSVCWPDRPPFAAVLP